ncbi:MAG: DUF3169 family protein [Bacillus sp. (in: firmicutes)]
MRVLLSLLGGGIVGFAAAYGILNFFALDFSGYTEPFMLLLLIAIAGMVGWGLMIRSQILKWGTTVYEGEKEDEMNQLVYTKLADFSLFINTAIVLSLLSLSITAVAGLPVPYAAISIILIAICYLLSANMGRLMKCLYPNRQIPEPGEPDFPTKLLAAADEGEKHIMLQGLYKSNNLLNLMMILAIITAIFYSVSTEQSQLFSIVLMCFVLILVNGKYFLSIRNK